MSDVAAIQNLVQKQKELKQEIAKVIVATKPPTAYSYNLPNTARCAQVIEAPEVKSIKVFKKQKIIRRYSFTYKKRSGCYIKKVSKKRN